MVGNFSRGHRLIRTRFHRAAEVNADQGLFSSSSRGRWRGAVCKDEVFEEASAIGDRATFPSSRRAASLITFDLDRMIRVVLRSGNSKEQAYQRISWP